jgi:uncharacterized protein
MLPLRSMKRSQMGEFSDSKQSIYNMPRGGYFFKNTVPNPSGNSPAPAKTPDTSTAHTGLGLNQFAALSFYDRDHGDGRGPERGGALAWLDELLAQSGITDADGEAWLHCYPRVWGFTFKPVSFWYCHHRDNSLRAIVVEVNNTFGERHCYLLDAPRYGVEQRTDKVFHVSPFCAVQGDYRFRFMRTASDRTVVRIDHGDADGPLLQTSVSGDLVPLTRASVRRALWRYPAMTWGVVARIHWQAVKLWCKGIPYFSKPIAPRQSSPLGSVSH